MRSRRAGMRPCTPRRPAGRLGGLAWPLGGGRQLGDDPSAFERALRDENDEEVGPVEPFFEQRDVVVADVVRLLVEVDFAVRAQRLVDVARDLLVVPAAVADEDEGRPVVRVMLARAGLILNRVEFGCTRLREFEFLKPCGFEPIKLRGLVWVCDVEVNRHWCRVGVRLLASVAENYGHTPALRVDMARACEVLCARADG